LAAKSRKGRFAQPGRLATADAVLDPSVGAVACLQCRQIGVGLVGGKRNPS
jgi:hypothetical protein